MINRILQKITMGIAAGGLLTFIALTVIKFTHVKSTVDVIWLYMLASLILGVYFSLASFIFEIDSWSPLKQTIIHFLLTIGGFFLIAIPIGWIPFHFGTITFGIIIFTVMYMLNWASFYFYYKKVADKMNKQLHTNK
ncbi:hypothetical protein HNQ35_002514 [Cerasibacillus quisquiliarum]|uniref:Permease n=1 Tax=Cerasibacillus quisquiliarum TaxID=227865 RepID=A0A511UZQ1_9BACI|nr:DUF3021 domain-containing protein [Cerasibacillus quisquiliarum]MBB5147296.1 hypothetical protein [Cerasibacillus quisquiliarum]GEN32135.1 permease [Cerasibacillus quisquiliarum]